ncbi:MAG TPA: hypothetical protein VLA78_07355, partial [Paracoccaceae bacterium]|nr:hypothetical protein [Paracoccaceae bacterium]
MSGRGMTGKLAGAKGPAGKGGKASRDEDDDRSDDRSDDRDGRGGGRDGGRDAKGAKAEAARRQDDSRSDDSDSRSDDDDGAAPGTGTGGGTGFPAIVADTTGITFHIDLNGDGGIEEYRYVPETDVNAEPATFADYYDQVVADLAADHPGVDPAQVVV